MSTHTIASTAAALASIGLLVAGCASSSPPVQPGNGQPVQAMTGPPTDPDVIVLAEPLSGQGNPSKPLAVVSLERTCGSLGDPVNTVCIAPEGGTVTFQIASLEGPPARFRRPADGPSIAQKANNPGSGRMYNCVTTPNRREVTCQVDGAPGGARVEYHVWLDCGQRPAADCHLDPTVVITDTYYLYVLTDQES